MAKVTFINPLAYLRGKLGKNDQVVFHHRNTVNKDGIKTNYTSLYERPADHELSADEQQTRTRFAEVSKRVQAAYKDPAKLKTYKQQFAAQTSARSLRKFIWDAETALYIASL